MPIWCASESAWSAWRPARRWASSVPVGLAGRRSSSRHERAWGGCTTFIAGQDKSMGGKAERSRRGSLYRLSIDVLIRSHNAQCYSTASGAHWFSHWSRGFLSNWERHRAPTMAARTVVAVRREACSAYAEYGHAIKRLYVHSLRIANSRMRGEGHADEPSGLIPKRLIMPTSLLRPCSPRRLNSSWRA